MAKDGKDKSTVKPVNLALQGGGSHGAFTWGVLDKLLEHGGIGIDAVSGTSAGAMNAVALADGWLEGGPDGAREKLDTLWREVGDSGRFSPIQRTPWDVLWGNWSIQNSPTYIWYDAVSHIVSPYAANFFDLNPLRDVVERTIDFERVRACKDLMVFVSATNVHTGRLRVFQTAEITLDAVMASACLPHVFKAVEIDGVPYWDGGYGGNPALFPFFYTTRTEDVLLVQINPIERLETPISAREIENRIDEITFNASLLREFRAIAFVRQLIAQGKLSRDEYRDIRMHRIDADEALKDLSASSKVNAEPDFLIYLRDLGRAAAEDWLEDNYGAIGKNPTLDLSDELEDGFAAGALPHKVGHRVREFLARRSKPKAAKR